MQSTSVFLPGKFHGLLSLADYSPWGCKESDMTKRLSTHIRMLGDSPPFTMITPGPKTGKHSVETPFCGRLPPGFLSEDTACPDCLTWWAPDQSLWLHHSWPQISPAKATVSSVLTPLPSPTWPCTHFCPSFPHLHQTSSSSSSWDLIAGRSDLGFRNLACQSTFSFFYHLQLEREMATHSSFLAWRILWTVEPGGLWSIGSQRVGHDWNNLAGSRQASPSIIYISIFFSERKIFLPL